MGKLNGAHMWWKGSKGKEKERRERGQLKTGGVNSKAKENNGKRKGKVWVVGVVKW